MGGFSARPEEYYSTNLGSLQDAMSGSCKKHLDLIIRFNGDWENSEFVHKSLHVCKNCGSGLQLFSYGIPSPPFELIYQSSSDASYLTISTGGGEIYHTPDGPSGIIGRGRLLDKNWIQLDTVKGWYRMCINGHGSACSCPSFTRHLRARPAILIDTKESCLVAGSAGGRYMALSYVWGKVDMLKLNMDNAEILRSPGSLRDEDITERIPMTVLHAIELTRLLGERYLWVDSLCIFQDDGDNQKQKQLSDMTAIYGNACMTIIAADGSHADHGLRGIQKVSRPVRRALHQHLVPFGGHGNVVERIFPSLSQERQKKYRGNIYYQRAWTFQEYLF